MRPVLVAGIVLAFSVPSLAHFGPHTAEEDVFTFYRSSAVDNTMRIHVATFDASAGGSYNGENCAIASDLFRGQPGVSVAYWCERVYVKDYD